MVQKRDFSGPLSPPLPSGKVVLPSSWDLPLKKYATTQRLAALNFGQGRSSPEEGHVRRPGGGGHDDDDDEEEGGDRPDVCARLFEDYLRREKKAREISASKNEQQQSSSLLNARGMNPVIQAEKQRLRHGQIKREHAILSRGMSIQRELEVERSAYMKSYNSRLYPPVKVKDPRLDGYWVQLKEFGDPKRNAASINALLSSQNEEGLEHFITRVAELRNAQKAIFQQYFDCQAYDSFIEKQMTRDVVKDALDILEELLGAESPLLEQVEGEEGGFLPLYGWMQDPNQRVATIDQIFSKMDALGFWDDLDAKRRELASEKSNLMLSLLNLLTRCDISMRTLLTEYRLTKFHVKGYEGNAVENVKSNEWYRDLGSTTSLRNNMKIKQSIRTVMRNVRAVLLRETPLPDLENDPNRRLLEEVLQFKEENNHLADEEEDDVLSSGFLDSDL